MVRNWFLLIVAGFAVVGAQASQPGVEGLTISAPRNDATIVGPNVVVSGYGDAGTVSVRVFRGNERVYSDIVTVNNGRWKTVPFKLTNGAYVATVEQGTTTKNVAFTVGSSKGFGFVSPGNGDAVSGPDVTFTGPVDSGTVNLKIYKGDDIVFQKDVNAEDGKWTVTTRLADNTYRAEIQRGTTVRSIDFRVGAPLPGVTIIDTTPTFAIDSPRENSTVTGQSVTFSGRSTANSVSIRLYDGDTVVYQGAATVENGKWTMTRDMSVGGHTVVVQQNEIVKTTKFTVQSSSSIKPTVEPDHVAFGSPKSNATVKGPRVKFTGTSSTPSIGVYIFQGDTRVFAGSQDVKDGRWAFTTTLQPGTYRVELTAGKAHNTLDITVK
jgi:hypothetical protein